jgi:hypothetical protein
LVAKLYKIHAPESPSFISWTPVLSSLYRIVI